MSCGICVIRKAQKNRLLDKENQDVFVQKTIFKAGLKLQDDQNSWTLISD